MACVFPILSLRLAKQRSSFLFQIQFESLGGCAVRWTQRRKKCAKNDLTLNCISVFALGLSKLQHSEAVRLNNMVPSPGNLENCRHFVDPLLFPKDGNTDDFILWTGCMCVLLQRLPLNNSQVYSLWQSIGHDMKSLCISIGALR